MQHIVGIVDPQMQDFPGTSLRSIRPLWSLGSLWSSRSAVNPRSPWGLGGALGRTSEDFTEALPLKRLLTKIARHQPVMKVAGSGSNPAPATNSTCTSESSSQHQGHRRKGAVCTILVQTVLPRSPASSGSYD